MSKYQNLEDRLRESWPKPVLISFQDIDELIGGLPPSARRHSAWWANYDDTHPHCHSWNDAGYVAAASLSAKWVQFEPVGPVRPRT